MSFIDNKPQVNRQRFLYRAKVQGEIIVIEFTINVLKEISNGMEYSHSIICEYLDSATLVFEDELDNSDLQKRYFGIVSIENTKEAFIGVKDRKTGEILFETTIPLETTPI